MGDLYTMEANAIGLYWGTEEERVGPCVEGWALKPTVKNLLCSEERG